MAIKTGRTMFLSLGGTTLVLTNLQVATTASEIKGAVTNATAGNFPEREINEIGIQITGQGTYTEAVAEALQTAIEAAVVVAYIQRDETGTGLKQRTGNCFVTSFSKAIPAGAERTFSVTVTLDGAPTVSPQLAMTPAAGALSGQVGVAFSQVFATTGGNDPYVYTMRGFVPGLSLAVATLSGTPIAGCQGTYLFEITTTDDDGVALTQEYTLVVAAA